MRCFGSAVSAHVAELTSLQQQRARGNSRMWAGPGFGLCILLISTVTSGVLPIGCFCLGNMGGDGVATFLRFRSSTTRVC